MRTLASHGPALEVGFHRVERATSFEVRIITVRPRSRKRGIGNNVTQLLPILPNPLPADAQQKDEMAKGSGFKKGEAVAPLNRRYLGTGLRAALVCFPASHIPKSVELDGAPRNYRNWTSLSNTVAHFSTRPQSCSSLQCTHDLLIILDSQSCCFPSSPSAAIRLGQSLLVLSTAAFFHVSLSILSTMRQPRDTHGACDRARDMCYSRPAVLQCLLSVFRPDCSIKSVQAGKRYLIESHFSSSKSLTTTFEAGCV